MKFLDLHHSFSVLWVETLEFVSFLSICLLYSQHHSVPQTSLVLWPSAIVRAALGGSEKQKEKWLPWSLEGLLSAVLALWKFQGWFCSSIKGEM